MPGSNSGKALVLVVGAGASKEAGLPVGGELKRQIAKALDITYDYSERKSGDDLIAAAFRKIDANNINQLLEVSRRICDAMPQAISIDNFIDQHRSEEQIAVAGKLAIARCILTAESKSPMKIDRSNIYNKLNFEALENTWFNAFFQLLTENCQKTDLAERFQKVAIICFNYDRCIEHYLHSSLQNFYKMPLEEATASMAQLKIYHPYGTVGELPWQSRDQGIEFGETPGAQQLVVLAKKIRTFTEGTDTGTSEIASIRTALASADRIAFLGFAFHRLNIQLLFPSPPTGSAVRTSRVFGTAINISKSDIQVITDELINLALINQREIRLDSSLTCAKLFSEFWRSLAIL